MSCDVVWTFCSSELDHLAAATSDERPVQVLRARRAPVLSWTQRREGCAAEMGRIAFRRTFRRGNGNLPYFSCLGTKLRTVVNICQVGNETRWTRLLDSAVDVNKELSWAKQWAISHEVSAGKPGQSRATSRPRSLGPRVAPSVPSKPYIGPCAVGITLQDGVQRDI